MLTRYRVPEIDVEMGLICRSYHSHIYSKEFKVLGGDIIFGAFIACYKLTVERDIHLHTAVSF